MMAVPLAAEAVVVTVMVAVPPAVTDAGVKLAVTPAGAPDADSATGCAVPDTTAVDTVTVVDEPAVTVPEPGLSDSEKSLAGVVPDGRNDHCRAGPPVHLTSTTFPPDWAAQRLLITRNAPWKVNCWLAAPLHAAVVNAVPTVELLPGSFRHCPEDLFLYWPMVLLGWAPP